MSRKKMTFDSYREYLKSDNWRERRKELMEEAGGICADCGDKATQLHHLNYDNLGEEELDVDVIALCNACHKERHGNKDGMDGYGDYGM